MEKWVPTLLSISVLMSYPLLTKGLPVQQVPSPVQGSEREHCEFDGFQKYDEQCSTETITLSSCNPGQRRVWWCVPTTGLPDDFEPDNNVYICGDCPRNTFQKWYNKCRTCYPCTECGEGETMEKECDMEQDTKCAKVSTTSSLPFEEGTPSSTPHQQPSTKGLPTDATTMIPNQTDLPRESPVELPKATPHDTKDWIYLAVIILMTVLLILALIGWWREWLLRKRPIANPLHDIPLHPINNNNGDVPHEGDEDGQPGDPGEQAPLLGGCPGEEGDIGRDPVDGAAMPATGHPAVDGHSGIQLPEGSPDDAADLEVDDGRSGSASEGGPDFRNDVALDFTTGSASDSATNEDGGLSDGALESPADVEEHGASVIPDHTDGSNCDEGTSSSGLIVNIPVESPVGVSNGATGDLSDDLTTSEEISDARATSASGDGFSVGVNTDGAATSNEVDGEDTPNESTVDSNDAAIGGTCGVQGPPNSALEERTTNASDDGNAIKGTDSTDCGAEASRGGEEELIDESTHNAPASARDGACGHPCGGAGDDDRRTETVPEQINPGIRADDVVTTQFLQHVVQEVPHIKIKGICRMLGLRERDIDDVEALRHKDEQAFEFLKKLLDQIGKDFTYRALIQVLNKSKSKLYADNLIQEFSIEL